MLNSQLSSTTMSTQPLSLNGKKEFNDKKVYFLSFHEFVISAAIFSSATQFEVSKENSKLSNNGNYRI